MIEDSSVTYHEQPCVESPPAPVGEASESVASRFSAFFDAAPIGVFWADAQGRFIAVNPALARLFSFASAEEMKASLPTVDDAFSPEARMGERILGCLETGRPQVVFETRIVRDEALLLSISLNSAPDAQGRRMVQGFCLEREAEGLARGVEEERGPLVADFETFSDVSFESLFNLEQLQRIQDAFAQATGVASLITRPDGSPITKPSNFCRLCNDVIRKTELGRHNCFASDAAIGRHNPNGPIVQPCLSGGLWDAGASITVGGKHIANWLIGQVRNETQRLDEMLRYADEIGADREVFAQALQETPVMSLEKFQMIAEALFLLANEMSEKAFQNLLKARVLAERDKAQQSLKESEERFRALIEQAQDGVYVHTFDGRYILVNQSACDCLGYTREELLALSVTDVDPLVAERGDAERFWTSLPRVFESQSRCKDGRLFPTEVRLSKIRFGETDVVYASVLDISARKKAEQDVREAGLFLEKIVNSIADPVFVKDAEHRFVLANDALCALLGKTREEVIGNSDLDFLPKEQVEVFWERDNLVIEHGGEDLHEEKLNDASGAERVAFTKKTLYVDNAGRKHVVGIIRDITDQKRHEEALKQNAAALRSIVDNMPFMAWLKDKKGVFLAANEPLAAACGAARQDILGKTDYDVWPIDFARANRSADAEVMAVKKQSYVEETIPDQRFLSSGEVQWYETFRTALTGEDGEAFGSTGFSRNITVKKRREEELSKALELSAAASKAKDEFLANMSHEIRTPLNGVLGMLQLLSKTSLQGIQQQYVETGLSAGRSLLQIISDILDLSKIEAGKLTIEEHEFDLETLISTVVNAFQEQTANKGVDMALELNIESIASCPLVGDETRLRQILFNLVGNAVKFTDKGEVRVRVEASSLPENRVSLAFTVSDTGTGIPADKLKSIFEPFTQADGSYTRKHQGAGLGLTIVKRLVELMGGSIHLESELNKGTRVFFEVEMSARRTPARAVMGVSQTVEAERGAATSKEAARTGACRILLVEDDEINQLSIQGLLEHFGYETLLASDGIQALSALRTHRVDAALMDIQMPRMDGVETTRRIRAGQAGAVNKTLPIIALTAHAMEGDRGKFLDAGLNGYISKPVDMDDLKKTLDKILGSPSPVSP
jgi:PAS domain S-box-containing protein